MLYCFLLLFRKKKTQKSQFQPITILEIFLADISRRFYDISRSLYFAEKTKIQETDEIQATRK